MGNAGNRLKIAYTSAPGRKALILFAAFASVCAIHCVWACDTGTVRDAAARAKRDMHRLCVIANEGDAAADVTFKGLEAWLGGDARALNMILERVNAGDATVSWSEYGIPSIPPQLPVVALIGEFASPRRVFVIDHWQPGPSESDLEHLRSSPAREALKEVLTSRWAAILYAPASEQAAPGIEAMLWAVEEKWAAEQSPGVGVVRMDRASPLEGLLRAFAGIEPSGPDWLAVVFGRGKLMAPPLQGDEITGQSVNGLLQQLAVPCTCLQQAIAFGLDIPMTWETPLNEKIPYGTSTPGYVEMTLEPPGENKELQPLAAMIPQEEHRFLVSAIVPLAGAGVVALLAVALAIRRSRQRTRGCNPLSSEERRCVSD